MSHRDIIAEEMRKVAAEQGVKLVPLNDDTVLLECGLDSLCFAILVARLEDAVGHDPFSASEDIYFPVTFADFVRFYDRVPA